MTADNLELSFVDNKEVIKVVIDEFSDWIFSIKINNRRNSFNACLTNIKYPVNETSYNYADAVNTNLNFSGDTKDYVLEELVGILSSYYRKGGHGKRWERYNYEEDDKLTTEEFNKKYIYDIEEYKGKWKILE